MSDFTKLRAVLLDRDGVLNEEPGPPLTPEEFVWIPGSAEAVALLNRQGWLVTLVTNQSVFARGRLTESGLAAIHQKMRKELAEVGGKVDGIFYCPHHPKWENGRLRTAPAPPCGCRKPEPGLLAQAGAAFGFMPDEAVLIGDKTSDFEAAVRWGCPNIGVRTGYAGSDGNCDRSPDVWAEDLSSAVEWLLGQEESRKPKKPISTSLLQTKWRR